MNTPFENVLSTIDEESLVAWETANVENLRARRRLDAIRAMDTLHRACRYLSMSWGVDTPRERMKGNLDARMILIRLSFAISNEQAMAERLAL